MRFFLFIVAALCLIAGAFGQVGANLGGGAAGVGTETGVGAGTGGAGLGTGVGTPVGGVGTSGVGGVGTSGVGTNAALGGK